MHFLLFFFVNYFALTDSVCVCVCVCVCVSVRIEVMAALRLNND